MSIPDFVTPPTPDLTPVLEIHSRHGKTHGDYITIHRKVGSRFEDLVSIRASEIRQYFPAIIGLLETDSYFSVNAFRFPRSRRDPSGEWSPVKSKFSPDGLDLPYPNRKKKNLQWLTACFCDIDCYGLGVSAGQAIGAIIDAQDAGTIPAASMLFRSGKGVWAFWFLVGDVEGTTLVPAFPEKIDLWYLIQNRLGELFAKVGADANARDPSRITRFAGSVNSKVGSRVAYWIQGDQHGRRFVYRLRDLALRLGVIEPRHAAELPREKSAAHQIGGKAAWRIRWQKQYADFIRLWSMRGGFRIGMRGRAVGILVKILRTMKVPAADIHDEVRRLFQSLEQSEAEPFTEDELVAAVASTTIAVAAKGKALGRKTVANYLDITPDEAAEMSHWTIPASRFRDLDAERQQQDAATAAAADKLSRAERAKRRRAALSELLDNRQRKGSPKIPGLKRLAEWLTLQGHECTFRTVKDDLDEIGIVNPRRHRRRRKAADADAKRPLLPPFDG